MQFYVGRQLLDHVSLKDAPGADDEGFDRGRGEVDPGAKTSKSVVDKYLRFRDDEKHCFVVFE